MSGQRLIISIAASLIGPATFAIVGKIITERTVCTIFQIKRDDTVPVQKKTGTAVTAEV